MYAPKIFDEPRTEMALDLIRARPFATVVGVDARGDAEIAHVPLLGEPIDGSIRLAGHVARANPLSALVRARAFVTAVFQGPEAYVSAAWYEQPREQVPTWNYAVVHVEGTLAPLDDAALTEHLTAMAGRFEESEDGWSPALLEPAFFADLRSAIVGFVIEARSVRTKLKLSQNRSPADRSRVVDALAASASPRDREVAALMSMLPTKSPAGADPR